MPDITGLLVENLSFLTIATAFLAIVTWAWQQKKPYTLPKPLPGWFTIWFLSVQILGVLPPLAVLLYWGVWQGYTDVLAVFSAYFILLALQIVSESLTLRRFQTVAWVMVPYLYVPYRVWQLYEGLAAPHADQFAVKSVLILEMIVWTTNYGLDLSQLPRLLRWEQPGVAE